MFHRIHTYHRIVGADGISYLPRAYGEPNSDGSWNGYLAFFARTGEVLATDRQITEPILPRLKDWANSLFVEDLDVALARARVLNQDSLIETEIARLKFLENEALLDAGALEERAELDEEAAAEARENAERLRRKRLAVEADADRSQRS